MTALTSRHDGYACNLRLLTLDGADGYRLIDDAALLWRYGHLTYAGTRAGLPDGAQAHERYDLGNALVTPGLVDCHTHIVFAGERAQEFEWRLQGQSYEAIARQGGGILSTVRAVRAASEAELLAQSLPRVQALMADGVTTLEIKSGYGLDLENEAKMLRVARRIATVCGLEVRTTYLAAHALPEEFAGRADAYVDALVGWLPQLAAEGLVDAVDAFCEGIGFSPQQTRRVFTAARELGLPVKLHADQLSDLNGAALAAEFSALSADHIEYTNAQGVAAMREAGTVAVLLPGAFHVLRETRLPPVAQLREAGVPMAVATDCNPGTSPLLSLRQAMQLACTHFRLTPEEALRGASEHAARALGLDDRGVLRAGQRADFALWQLQHPAELCYWLGGTPCLGSFIAGQPVRLAGMAATGTTAAPLPG